MAPEKTLLFQAMKHKVLMNIRYECELVRQNTIMQGTCHAWEKLTPSSLGIRGRHKKNEQAHPVLNDGDFADVLSIHS